ncbi:glycoside hydrolase family 2 TIM barrel-domain containing protein [Saccharicrinis sp. GN24d3]|uniref:glycoside hydrolase family 2 TIM barrel-domain containing protein n=1 Tax=Saccharicrinis sp. GN24d3 TaxID=3458416 RepID=UPI0040352F1E
MIQNISISLLLLITLACQPKVSMQRNFDFNTGWQFYVTQDSTAHNIDLSALEWKTVQLPHDWSVEFPFDSVKGEGCTGYLPGGIGWYKKEFNMDVSDDEKVYVWFDGVYNNSEYWLNGQKLGEHPYGYSPFYFDLSNHLNTNGRSNELVVKVDRSRYADSRWYSGSGIYRNVKLVKVNKLHIPIWGTFVKTPSVSEDQAVVEIEISVNNTKEEHETCDVVTEIIDPEGTVVGRMVNEGCFSKSGSSTITHKLSLKKPRLWDIKKPQLYIAKTSIIRKGELIDQYSTPFGIRSFRFDKDKGFFLNNENMKIKGVCLHHDAGLVGAAVPKGVWRRRLQLLKDAGCNAIRVSHNPASDEFLELCDEMGFLVQDEFFDEWDYPKDKRFNMNERHDDYITRGYTEHFQQWAKFDLTNTMLAHRNHPCVFQWSIGNEIEWTYPRNAKATGFFGNMNWDGNYFWSPPPFSPERIKKEYESLPKQKYEIGKTAHKLAKWTRELDTTRPVIANCILPSASLESGYADALDVVGYSYRRVMYDYARGNYPDKTVMGTENVPQWHEWKAIEDRPYISGTFLWTGFDYMGESNGHWPQKATPSGLLDLAGFPKPPYHMYKTLWNHEPHIYMCTNTAAKSQYHVVDGKLLEKKPGAWEQFLWFWYDVNEHWNYKKGEEVIVEVISNASKVELLLNEKSLGVKELAQFPDRIYKWSVPFVAGKLVAKAVESEAMTEIQTSGNPAALNVEVDHNSLLANGADVAHIVVQVVDENNNPVRDMELELMFEVAGPIISLGVDNGCERNVQAFQSNKIKTHQGRAMMIVQARDKTGSGTIIIKSDNLKPVETVLRVQ